MLPPQNRRELARDPRFFGFYYLNLTPIRHQNEWCRLFSIQYLLKLAPRGHGKSDIDVYLYILWKIYNDYAQNAFLGVNWRGILIEKIQLQAKKEHDRILMAIRTNERLREDYGDLLGTAEEDTGLLLRLRRATKSEMPLKKEYTLESTGVEGAITGSHPLDIINDDILDDENTRTIDRMNSTENWFWGTVWNLKLPVTRVRVIGTRKNRRDLYSTIERRGGWKKVVQQAVLKYPDKYDYIKNDDGEVVDVRVEGEYQTLWDEDISVPTGEFDEHGKEIITRWGIQELLLDRFQQGSIIFDREKQNRFTAEGGNLFQTAWLQYWETGVTVWQDGYGQWILKEVEERLAIVIGLDFSVIGEEEMRRKLLETGKRSDPDFFAAVVFGVSRRKRRVYMLDVYCRILDYPQQITLVNFLKTQYRPITKYAMQRAAVEIIAKQELFGEERQRGQIYEVPMTNKNMRITGASASYENGTVLLRGTRDQTGQIVPYHTMAAFVDQWEDFGLGGKVDALDAAAGGLEACMDILGPEGGVTIVQRSNPIILTNRTRVRREVFDSYY